LSTVNTSHGYDQWSLAPLQQCFSYIMAVSFISGGNRSTLRKNQQHGARHWQFLSHNVVSSSYSHITSTSYNSLW